MAGLCPGHPRNHRCDRRDQPSPDWQPRSAEPSTSLANASCFLSLYCSPDVVIVLDIDEALESILFGKAVGYTFSMFPYPAPQVARHANIQRPVRPIGHYVNPTARHLLKAALLRVPVRNARRWPGQARP